MDLASRYTELVAAARAGDERRASELFHTVIGLHPTSDVIPDVPGPPRAPLFRFDVPRAIDLRALRRGVRAIAKFEDLMLEQAIRLEEAMRAESFTVARSGPYSRRFDVLLTGGGPRHYYNVVVSRGELAQQFVEAERDRSAAGVRRAGLLLGYPRCCTEHFIEMERRPEAEIVGVNELALRDLADGSPTIPWELNPLSQHSPVGFAVCSARCTEALGFARRMLGLLSGEELERVRRVLSRPLLVLRLPLIWAFDGAFVGDETVAYEQVAAHDHGVDQALLSLGERTVGRALAVGSRVRLDDSVLAIEGESGRWRWALEGPRVPRLLRFH